MHSSRLVALFALLLAVPAALSQTPPRQPYYSRLNTYGIFGEYSNTSSHILLGVARNRKLLNFGGFYTRRILLNHVIDAQYMAELRPIMLESDPLFQQITTLNSPPPVRSAPPIYFTSAEACHPYSENVSFTYQGVTYHETEAITCGHRQWTFGEGLSPIGFKANLLPRHRLQPVFTALAGYMFSTKSIPVENAGSWNFTFEAGVGLEFYRSATRSIRAEYLLHHISNDYTAFNNPGIDNQMIQFTYAFGR